MAYTKPVTFTAGTTLLAGDLQANDDALRVYLHEDVTSADLQQTNWIDTRHIQPPTYNPILGVQHGVTGHQGSQWAGGVKAGFTFCTSFVTGGARSATQAQWEVIPGTAMKFDIRKPGVAFFHWWVDSLGGPDTVPNAVFSDANKRVAICPYHTNHNSLVNIDTTYAQETCNNTDGFDGTNGGALFPYNVSGYGQRQGTFRHATSTGTELVMGLCQWSSIDRMLIFNWGISVEIFYL